MALIKCHECGNEVSDQAQACPKCGAPVIARIRRQQKNVLIELGIRIVLAVVIGVTFWLMWKHVFKSAMAPLKVIEQKQQSTH
jgi:DNA-directed RNA polymerase subunit RPC12/RpoP